MTTSTEKEKIKYDWLNKNSRRFLKRDYLTEGVEPEERIREIAETAEKILGIKGFADKFENYMSLGYYSLSTPVWTNFGNKRGLPISCYGSYIDDTMESILYKASEVGIMSKAGGGTSGYFGDLRHRGAKISIGGESSGPTHFMEIYDAVCNVVSQGQTRRGNFAAYLPVEHPDIMEFLEIREDGHAIQNMSIGVTITDKWMKEMVDGDKEKRSIWARIIKKRFETGYPYIQFIDNCNKKAPKVYKEQGRKITHSNLCVAPETILLTKEGGFAISTLEDKEVEVWNGQNWSKTKVVKTGTNQRLIKVVLSDDRYLECTEYHKWYVKPPSGTRTLFITKRTNELSLDDEIYEPKRKKLGKVKQIIDKGRKDHTYCVNEPVRNSATFNDITTGQCSEICLSDNEIESFVCCLSSYNLEKWEEIKESKDAIETLIYFLDAVMEEFITKTRGNKFMEHARNFAVNQRALGAGVLGWHSLLQSRSIPFESMEAKYLNAEIFKTIEERTNKATKELAELFGEPPMLKGFGVRNITTTAIAPTTSSSFILGQVSPSIEPLNSNYFVKKLAKGNFTYKNPYLRKLLKEKDQDNPEVWNAILLKGGSVQDLSFLTQEEKDVFKTFGEISQKEIVIQAAQRQKYIDQGQSLNIMVPLNTPAKQVSELLIEGWKLGIKAFYYQRSANPSQELSRSILECKSCEG